MKNILLESELKNYNESLEALAKAISVRQLKVKQGPYVEAEKLEERLK